VRFRDSREVHQAVRRAVEATLAVPGRSTTAAVDGAADPAPVTPNFPPALPTYGRQQSFPLRAEEPRPSWPGWPSAPAPLVARPALHHNAAATAASCHPRAT